jgi:hypothetical protein
MLAALGPPFVLSIVGTLGWVSAGRCGVREP